MTMGLTDLSSWADSCFILGSAAERRFGSSFVRYRSAGYLRRPGLRRLLLSNLLRLRDWRNVYTLHSFGVFGIIMVLTHRFSLIFVLRYIRVVNKSSRGALRVALE